jgi:osmotically-inducible protein OsmY
LGSATEGKAMIKRTIRNYLVMTAFAVAGGLMAMQAKADEDGANWTGEAKDAWIAGKLEAVYALNRHLNPFTIDTDVENGLVRLSGNVSSDIDRDLAGELAKGIDGVVEVDNDLVIREGARDELARADRDAADAAEDDELDDADRRPFGVWIDDATTTAMVKSKLLGNPNTEGLEIDVDTRGDVVTLSGQVSSAEQKELAEELARNTGDVRDVDNRLVVERS